MGGAARASRRAGGRREDDEPLLEAARSRFMVEIAAWSRFFLCCGHVRRFLTGGSGRVSRPQRTMKRNKPGCIVLEDLSARATASAGAPRPKLPARAAVKRSVPSMLA